MAKSKKRQRLEDAGLLDPGGRLSKDQSAAVDSLTPEEVEAVISARKKLKNAFHPGGITLGVTTLGVTGGSTLGVTIGVTGGSTLGSSKRSRTKG